MSHNLKQAVHEYMKENVQYFNYKILAELAVIYATKMDPRYQGLFFAGDIRNKFLKELKHLDQETFYKVLWALVKAKAISIDEHGGSEWGQVREAVVAKMKDFDAKTLTNVLVLSTVAKDA